jgi:formiminotetrahydrofolate cyclodeaminase
MSTGLSDLPLAAIAEAVGSDTPVPGGGAVAACTGAATAIARQSTAGLTDQTPERRSR